MIHRMFLAVTSAYSLTALSLLGASFQGLGDFPGGYFLSIGQGTSADGSVIVGYGTTSSGNQSFRWTPSGGMVSLGNLPGGILSGSQAQSVSADGSVVVGFGNYGSDTKGFRWTQSTGMVDLNDLPGGSTHCMAWRISADGSTVVGESDSASGREAFRWTQSGGMVGLGDLPGGNFKSIAHGVSADGSVVVGEGSSALGQEAFRWTQSGGMVELGVLSGCTNSVAMNVSADGLVVVGFCGSASGTEPFRWTQSTGMVRIGDNPAGQLFPPMALAASADGSMIVGVANLVRGAFIWDAAHGIRRLQTVLQTDYGLKVAGWRNFSAAFDISPDGSAIAGFGTNPSGQTEAFRAVLDVIPKLAISLSDANVNLAWSSNFPDFALESTGQVAGTWTPVPDVTGYSATLPVNAQSQFFRLRK